MHRIWTVMELLTVILQFYLSTVSCNGMLRIRESEAREVKDLSGLWNFRADKSQDRSAGFRESWFTKPLSKNGKTIPMPVPSSYNDITQDRSLRDFIGWAWYDREVYAPSTWRNNKTRVVLRFESAHYYSIVWLNGKEIMQHNGGHLPFEADVTNDLYYDRANRITAAINNTLTPTTLPPGEIVWPTGGDGYPPGYFVQKYTFDFFNYAGIHRPVKLYTTPVVYLSDITIVTSLQDPQSAFIDFVSVIGAISTVSKDQITMQYQLIDKDDFVVATTGGRGMFEGRLEVKNPILWWPVGMSNVTAYLYTLKVVSAVSSEVLSDVYRIPVGIRTVRVEGTKFLINNKPFYFKGFGKHEDSDIRGKGMDYALIAKDFNLMKWLGGNSFRTSHYPYAEEIMDMADEQGIVVVDETPGVGIGVNNYETENLEHHIEVIEELIRRDKNRPAVVLWSVANEPKSDIPKATTYFKPIFEVTRKLDPTRPVTYVTHFKAWNDKVSQFVDVIFCNRYYAWYHDYGETQLISNQLEKELTDWYKTFNKPVVQAEYGADTVAGLHVDPPVMFTEEYQVETLQQYFPVFDKLRSEFFVGEMIWNFADFMTTQGVTRVVGNKKGILTRQRQPKAAAFVLRQRYLNITLEQTPSNTGDDLLDALIKFESRTPATMAATQALYSQGRK